MTAQQPNRVTVCKRCNKPLIPTAGGWLKKSGQVCVCQQTPPNAVGVLSLSREDINKVANSAVKNRGRLVSWTINMWPNMAGATLQVRFRPFPDFTGQQPLSDCVINVAL